MRVAKLLFLPPDDCIALENMLATPYLRRLPGEIASNEIEDDDDDDWMEGNE